MDFMSEYLNHLKEEIEQFRSQLKPLEAGEMWLGERKGVGPWVDTTAREIGRLKQAIANLEAIVADHTKNRAR